MKPASNIVQITVSDLPEILHLHADTPGSKPPLLLGLPGIGKTTGWDAFATSNKMDSFQFMASHYSVPDLKGFGVPNMDTKRMTFLPTEELPWWDSEDTYASTHGGRRPAILSDEFLQATPAVFNLLQQLFHEKRVGDRRLPPDVFMAAAANSSSMKCNSQRLTSALADRFAIYNIRPDLPSILTWMARPESGVYYWILAFIQTMNATGNGVLWSVPMDKWNGEEPLDSARSYVALSHVLRTMEARGPLGVNPLLGAVCAAHVGTATGARLTEFIRLALDAGDLAAMLRSPDTANIPDRIDVRWGIACRIIGAATTALVPNILHLARRLTPPSLMPSDPEMPTLFEAFVINGIMATNIRSLIASNAWCAWNKKYMDLIGTKSPLFTKPTV